MQWNQCQDIVQYGLSGMIAHAASLDTYVWGGGGTAPVEPGAAAGRRACACQRAALRQSLLALVVHDVLAHGLLHDVLTLIS